MGRKKNDKKNNEEGVVYKVNCKSCEKIYIGETRFEMKKRIEEHKKDVKFRRIGNSAMEEFNHEIDWDKAICLEKEKRLFPRKILESAYIKENKERCMDLNEGIRASKICGRAKGAWIKREKQGLYIKKKKKNCVYSYVYC